MSKKHILVVILIILSVVIYSCSKRYYTDYQGKVTKGYNKPPKELKK
jgi:hypothetical protein